MKKILFIVPTSLWGNKVKNILLSKDNVDLTLNYAENGEDPVIFIDNQIWPIKGFRKIESFLNTL